MQSASLICFNNLWTFLFSVYSSPSPPPPSPLPLAFPKDVIGYFVEYCIVVDGFNQYEFMLFSAGAQELLDSWLTLVSRLANSETLLDSPHSLPATSTALVFVPFEPIRFLVKTQKVRFQGRAPWWLNVKEKKKKKSSSGMQRQIIWQGEDKTVISAEWKINKLSCLIGCLWVSEDDWKWELSESKIKSDDRVI